jgi:RNA polymerase sigma-70 factor, ECF subfamily
VNDTEVFEQLRPRLFGVAYRMTGSVADADDICQDAWLRWRSTDTTTIDNPEAYLVRVVTHQAIDHARALHRKRETYIGPYLPEPLITPTADYPLEVAELADSLTFAFLVMLDTLDPIERAVILLHDVFGYTFDEVGCAMNRTSAACRKTASRARRTLRAQPAPTTRASDQHVRALRSFVAATVAGDINALIALLAPDIVQLDDTGGTRPAARRPVVGAERVARLMINLTRRLAPNTRAETVLVNTNLGLLLRTNGRPDLVLAFEFEFDDRIARIWVQANPEKLTHLN